MLDVLVPEVVLHGPSVVAVVGELVTAGVTQHVWVDRELDTGNFAGAFHELSHSVVVTGPPRSETNRYGVSG